MVSANSKMADTRSTLLECSVKIRQGRKWKSRWCVLTRQSPVSEEVILKFYKDQNALLTSKELGRERVRVSAHNYCGLEYGYRYPKNIYVLTIILSEAVILLSFQTHEKLLDWYHRIKNTLPSAAEFKSRVVLPNKGKLPAGQASLYFYSNHFALTPQTPVRLINAWNLSMVIRYGIFEGGFAFVARSNKGSVNHLLLLRNPEYIKNHFDAAMRKHLPCRFSTISEANPASIITAERQRLLHEEHSGHDLGEAVQNEDELDGDDVAGEVQLMNPGDSQSNTPMHSDSGVTTLNSDFGDIELRQIATGEGSQSDIDGSSGADLLSTETSLVNELLLCTPQKMNPTREQEYEVMASFDHYRSSLHEPLENGNCECLPKFERVQDSCLTCQGHSHRHDYLESRFQMLLNMDRFRLDLNQDGREYVNLSSPQSTLPRSVPTHRYKNSTVHSYLPKEIIDIDDFSPPSSPPPPPPLNRPSASLTSSKESSTLQRLNGDFDASDLDSLLEVPVPFEHSDLLKPLGPIARLKRQSSESDNSSYIASGSEYGDSSRYSSTASSRHNSFDREPLEKPPPVPPKLASLRLPLMEALLASNNLRQDAKGFESMKPQMLSTTSSSLRNPPPIPLPPKPDYLRGRPLKELTTPNSPTDRPTFLPSRKRCNTVPSFVTTEGDTEWVEPKEEGDDGYLIMKPAYEDKLKSMHVRSKSEPDEGSLHSQSLPPMPLSWMSSPGIPPPGSHSSGTQSFQDPGSSYMEYIPQSPIHDPSSMRILTLRRSATIGGQRQGLYRGASHWRSLTPEHTNRHKTSDISLSSGCVPRRRRSDKYGSLDHRLMSHQRSNKQQKSKENFVEAPESPTVMTPFLQGDFQQLKDDLQKYAGPLSLSPPSSTNSPSRSQPLTPASSVESVDEETVV